jgi:phage tail P2-like protein
MSNLLPPNSSALSQAFDAISAERIDAIPVPLRDLWNPWICPIELLPWLAWALSVDEWEESWPEQVKRQVVANSIRVHFHKGTRGAVEDALAALGIRVDLSEWFDQSPQGERGTVQLTAWVNQNLTGEDTVLTPRLYEQLKRAVDAVKRGSIHYDFRVGAAYENRIGLVSAISSSQVVPRDVNAIQAPVISLTSMGLVATAASISVARYTMEAA